MLLRREYHDDGEPANQKYERVSAAQPRRSWEDWSGKKIRPPGQRLTRFAVAFGLEGVVRTSYKVVANKHLV